MAQAQKQENKTKLCVFILLIKLERNKLDNLSISHCTTRIFHTSGPEMLHSQSGLINLSWKNIPLLFALLKDMFNVVHPSYVLVRPKRGSSSLSQDIDIDNRKTVVVLIYFRFLSCIYLGFIGKYCCF